MKEVYLSFIVAITSAVAGYLASYLKQKFRIKDEKQIEKTITVLEVKLKNFLWPLYFQFEQLVELGHILNEKQLLNYNKQIFQILHSDMHLIGENETVIIAVKYIKAFNTWRVSGQTQESFPFDEAKLFHTHLKEKTNIEQNRYNSLIGLSIESFKELLFDKAMNSEE